jgi:type IV secretory pathway ATPase VirB11/archaellum biosynthesis ATPase
VSTFDENTQPSGVDPANLPFFAPRAPQPTTREEQLAANLTRSSMRRGAIPTGTHPEDANQPTETQPTGAAFATVATGEEETQTLEERSALPWDEVNKIRDKVARILSEALAEQMTMPVEMQKQIAQGHIKDSIATEVSKQARDNVSSAWNSRLQNRIQRAVFDSLFNLGRLQPLVDEPGVENIHIGGFDNVWLSYDDGRVVRYEHPIALSDGDLVSSINLLASREGNRSFTTARPRLHLDLPGGARLAAIAHPTADRPTIVIRIHRLVDVTLNDLVRRGTLTPLSAKFLRAAVIAGVSIVTSGFPGAGKTTLLRALADVIPADEKLVTIEMERELYLHKLPERHPRVVSLEYRPGEGEPGPDGKLPGEITLEDLVADTLRLDTQRFIVGEVRGSEIYAMMQAMQSGVGSLSTLHAASGHEAIDRMSSLMLSKGQNVTPVYAYRMIEQNISLVVQIAKIIGADGKPQRVITEISEIQPGEASNSFRPVAHMLFRWDRATQTLIPNSQPSPKLAETLHHAGFTEDDMRSAA